MGAAWSAPPPPQPPGPEVALRAAIGRGAKLVQVCANCHGPGGHSQSPDVPHLAGQNASYLQEQMRRFVDGRRKDPFMSGMIKAMSEAERADVVAYLASETPAPPISAPADAAQLAHGKRYYENVCFRCHGAAAEGRDGVPRLAGQQPGYMVRSLRRYRDGSGERLEPQMAANTRQMSDADIAAVAAWLARQK